MSGLEDVWVWTTTMREDVCVDDVYMDRPTAIELLEVVAQTLSETVVPATAPHAQHQARVTANLCRIIGRELAAGEPPATSFPDSLLEIDDAAEATAYADVLELVRSKLAVVKPGYDTHGAAQEHDIIA